MREVSLFHGTMPYSNFKGKNIKIQALLKQQERLFCGPTPVVWRVVAYFRETLCVCQLSP